MRRYNRAEFTTVLSTFMNRSSFYRGLAGNPFMNPSDNTAHKILRDMELEAVWVAAVLHSVSQNGVDATYVAMEDDVALNEMFDWHQTGEGWAFWEAVNSLTQ